MGSIVVTEYVSLDGVMEGPGGGEDYKHVGWTFEVNRGVGESTGKRLFDDTTDTKRMQLIESRAVGDGVTILGFRPVGLPTGGSQR